MNRTSWVGLALLLLLPALDDASGRSPAVEFVSFDAIDRAEEAGELTAEQALLRKFQHAFEPDAVETALRGEGIVRCVTPLVARYQAERPGFSAVTRATIDAYLAPRAIGKTTYLSTGGHFELSYTTSGADAVPSQDINPLDGVPDYVQRVADYCEIAWQKEILELGFTAPALGGGRYQVSFADMAAYGYTTVGAWPGGTAIVVHNDFIGFPPNTDPDGHALGAAKVTVAHEFKHAIQYATSQWSEGGWVELDATWMEDVVFDDTNDYYNYLPSGSPISAPTTSLDAGGSGSYEDCVWQHYLSETYGLGFVVDLWSWRSTHLGQSMMASYDAVLQTFGSSLEQTWPTFAAWNYACGAYAQAGLGYEEAAAYPTAPMGASFATYPAASSGSLEKLSATFVRCQQLDQGPGQVAVHFTRTVGSKLEVTAVITRTDGVGVIERIPLVADTADDVLLSTPLESIASLGLVVSNGASSGAAKAWTLDVTMIAELPAPVASVSTTSLALAVEAGSEGQIGFDLGNEGPPGSILAYRAVVMPSWPMVASKSVEGSTVDVADPSYVPGTSRQFEFTVTNASVDEEWLTDVLLTFPPGVTVVSSSDFEGGSEGALVTDGATGDGVTLHWSDANGGFGNIYGGGEQATATVQLAFDALLSGDLTVDYTIAGDVWGSAPHEVASSLALFPLPDGLELMSPDGGELLAIGDPADITWTSTGELTQVELALSRDDGATWEILAGGTPNDGHFTWTVEGPATPQARVRVQSLEGSQVDVSAEPLLIYPPVAWADVAPATGAIAAGAAQALTVDVTAPAAGEGEMDAMVVVFHDGEASPTVLPLTMQITAAPTASPRDVVPTIRLEGNFPNPFNPATQIRFHLTTAERVTLRIFDAAGRHVRTLVDGPLPAGTHSVVWNGRDGDARAVASGVYRARLQTRTATDVSSMVLVR